MEKRSVLISGCSSGIGLHCARRLAPRWRVVAAVRRPEDAEVLRADGIETVQLDLDDSESIRQGWEKTLALTGGQLDALFNNGAYGLPGAVEDVPRDALRAQFETNVFGTQELTNRAIALMRQQGGGRIVQNSSVLGYVALKYRGAYIASKYALEGLTDTMRLELAGSGIHLALIEPGPITSNFRRNSVRRFRQVFDEARINNSVHKQHYQRQLATEENTRPLPFNLPPEAVYAALRHALESRRPKLRYRVTVPSKVFWYLKRAVPTAWLDALLRRV